MSKARIKEEHLDRVDDDRQISLELGKNLCKARSKAHTPDGKTVSFDWLSKVTTLHHGSIRRFEKGEIGMTVANLVRLKNALNCSWDDLLEGCESCVVESRKPHIRK